MADAVEPTTVDVGEGEMEQEIGEQVGTDEAGGTDPAAADTQPHTAPASQQAKKPKHPCITCGKNVTGASVQCTLCNLWCHKQCTNLSESAFKGLMLQAKEVGTAYWACRSCLSFAAKMNRHLQETSKRQDQLEERVNVNSNSITRNEQNVEELRQELRRALAKMDSEKEARDDALCEELREREIRRLNIIIHGLQEPDNRFINISDRIEADRRLCGELFAAMGARVRGQDLRFCRRVGERGAVPRPVVVGLNSEEEKRTILIRSRQLRGGRYDNVAVVPDLTKMQRRGEDKLSVEAGERNKNLTGEDNERGMRWIVIGKRGEKRLIKGVEREPQRDRGNFTLGQYIPRNVNGGGGGGSVGGGSVGGGYGGNNFGGASGNTNRQGAELGARPRDNQYSDRLLPPINRNDQYIPVQHQGGGQQQQQQQQQQQYQHQSQHQQYSANNGQQQQRQHQNPVGQQQQHRQLNNSGGNVNGNGGGFGGGGFGGGTEYNRNSSTATYSGSGYNSGYNNDNNGGGYRNGYNGDRLTERMSPYELGQEYGRQQSSFGNSNGAENTQSAETDRLVMRPGGLSEPVVPQPGQQRQRLGSKRGACNTSTEFSPPRTRQRH
jgi:hypothetical protein